jgi:hypothetical protein
VRISDFPKMFPFEKLDSDLRIKSTHAKRKNEEIFLNEYLPMKAIGTRGLKVKRFTNEELIAAEK